MQSFWNSLHARARAGLIALVLVTLCVFVFLAFWLFRGEQQVLFANLNAQDSAAMVAELDRMKTPYRIADDGQTILVDKASVHATRMKLMGRDLPLHGAVGFELFNNAEFGMTEFAQKINYQRALQGELTRTILALDEVRDVRVHLALPEDGLFKRDAGKGKAAVTLRMQSGRTLRPEQIVGIQRLVSASVARIAAADVTVVDGDGVVLSRAVSAPADAEVDGASARLDLKRDTEQLLARKVGQVLDKAFGAGEALASVDVTLNMDQLRVTTEEVLANAAAKSPRGAAGVIVRERETVQEAVQSPDARTGDAAVNKGGMTQREYDYQAGKRIEHLTGMPGAIRRIQVVAIVRKSLQPAQIEQVRALVSAAVGAVSDRGDQIVVQSLVGLSPVVQAVAPVSEVGTEPMAPSPKASADESSASTMLTRGNQAVSVCFGLLLLTTLVLGIGWALLRRGRAPDASRREDVLARAREWMASSEDAHALRR